MFLKELINLSHQSHLLPLVPQNLPGALPILPPLVLPSYRRRTPDAVLTVRKYMGGMMYGEKKLLVDLWDCTAQYSVMPKIIREEQTWQGCFKVAFGSSLGKRMSAGRGKHTETWADPSREMRLVPCRLRNHGLCHWTVEAHVLSSMVFLLRSPDIYKYGFKMDSWGPDHSVLLTGFLPTIRKLVQCVMGYEDEHSARDAGR